MPYLSPALATCAAVVTLMLVGNPLHSTEGDGKPARDYVAFSQHYSFNLSEAGRIAEWPWAGYVERSEAVFGDARGIAAIARANPGEMLWHVSRNVTMLPRAAFVSVSTRCLPWPKGLLALAVSALVAARWLHGPPRAQAGVKTIMACLAFSQFSELPAALLIYPQERYLVTSGLLVVMAAVSYAVRG